MTHASSFGITTPDEFLRYVVLPEYEAFVSDISSSRHALLTTITACHMYEWVHRTKFTVPHFTLAYPTKVRLAESFELARNIANGTKHYLPKATTQRHSGYSSAYSNGYARPFVVESSDNTKKSADVFLRELIEFWREEAKNGAF
jgi:hypothetical protein